MATLYESSGKARKVVIGFLAFTIILLAIEAISAINKNNIVNPRDQTRYYMNTDRIFGDIERPNIPSISLNPNTKPEYMIDDVFGLLPDVAYVYKIERPREKLQVFENAQKTVEILGFNPFVFEDQGNNDYQWTTAGNTKVIEFNKVSQVWNMTTRYTDNVEARRIKTLSPTTENYSREAERLISRLGFESLGLVDPLVDVRYAKLDNGIFFEKTPESNEGDYSKISIYRRLPFADLKPSNELPKTTSQALIPKPVTATVYSNDPRKGQINLVVSNNFRNYAVDIFELNYTNWEYSNTKGAYLIISPEEAWSYIQNGRGSLMSVIPLGSNYFDEQPDEVTIKTFTADRSKTRVAYWEPEEYLGYIYPIYVFEGRAMLEDGRQANFVYFVEAIKRVE